LTLKVPRGTTVAFVGQSGSGKSSLVNLIERFYGALFLVFFAAFVFINVSK